MNINFKENLEKISGSINGTIKDVLTKLEDGPKKDKIKEGVSLVDITKKLKEKKFGKGKKK